MTEERTMKAEVDDDLLDAAEEAAMNVADMDVPLRAYLRAALAAVIPLVQAAEREACAEVAKNAVGEGMRGADGVFVALAIMRAIRARNPATEVEK